MNPRRRAGTSVLSGSPVLVGAVTVIVAIVAVFLSYNANEGLPFVPTYSLTANVPNANGLVRGNEVRMGGSRIGVVTEIKTRPPGERRRRGQPELELDERIIPLPKDSTLIIRPRSALGLKYVEITKGTSKQGVRRGRDDPARRLEGADQGDRRLLQHVRRADARRLADQPRDLRRRRSPGAASRSTGSSPISTRSSRSSSR